MKYPINDPGVGLLKQSENFIGFAYPDPCSPLGRALQKAGLWQKVLKGAPIPASVRLVKGKELSGDPWTIGYGFTDGVEEGDTMTRGAADARLARELQPYVNAVQGACKIAPNENQLAALVVCAWNIGLGWDPDKPKPRGAADGLRNSSIMKAHNRGDFAAAARAFALWNKANGAVVEALVTRRAAEADLYRTPPPSDKDGLVDDEAPTVVPQIVQPESSLLRSPIVQGTGATAVTSLAALKEVADQAGTARDAVGTIGSIVGDLMPYWPYVAMAAVVIVAGATIYYRWKQRRGGWA